MKNLNYLFEKIKLPIFNKKKIKIQEELHNLLKNSIIKNYWTYDLEKDLISITSINSDKTYIYSYNEWLDQKVDPESQIDVNIQKNCLSHPDIKTINFAFKSPNIKQGGNIYYNIDGKVIKIKNKLPVKLSGYSADVTDIIMKAWYNPVTKYKNRNAFEEIMLNELYNNKRNNKKTCIAFFDIDNFKAYNTKFLHEGANKLLIEIANTVNNSIRESDELFHIFGDEFAIILRNIINLSDLEIIGKKILNAVNSLNAPDQNFKISISIGFVLEKINCISNKAQNENNINKSIISNLLEKSDKAMYCSKINGKNRFEIYQENMKDIIVQKKS